MSDTTYGKCEQNACNVAQSGHCLEGCANLADCEYFKTRYTLEVEQSERGKDQLNQNAREPVLFSEDEVYGVEVDRLLRASLCSVVVVAGSPESGKTTLFAELFEAFCREPFAGYLFAGSETLSGFEKRCFPARMDSEAAAPTTERTRHEETIRFLHLAVRDSACERSAQTFLFADVSGEAFRQIKLDQAETMRHVYIRRADHFVLLFDGGKLSDYQQRQAEKQGGLALLRILDQEGLIGKQTCVQIVFSRWDLALVSANSDEVRKFADGIETNIRRDFSDHFKDLFFIKVAARPNKNVLRHRYGLNDLFLHWVKVPASLNTLGKPVILIPRTIAEYLTVARHTQTNKEQKGDE